MTTKLIFKHDHEERDYQKVENFLEILYPTNLLFKSNFIHYIMMLHLLFQQVDLLIVIKDLIFPLFIYFLYNHYLMKSLSII